MADMTVLLRRLNQSHRHRHRNLPCSMFQQTHGRLLRSRRTQPQHPWRCQVGVHRLTGPKHSLNQPSTTLKQEQQQKQCRRRNRFSRCGSSWRRDNRNRFSGHCRQILGVQAT
ncbi:hypothetical protein BCR44DRAFT_1441236, partial [Catenaria anguillulae PL171]